MQSNQLTAHAANMQHISKCPLLLPSASVLADGSSHVVHATWHMWRCWKWGTMGPHARQRVHITTVLSLHAKIHCQLKLAERTEQGP
mmetsp:Transcript_3510/g.7656  ORF Transcript_3510/g.7656 Transcript_3510/m.7656 type:complete len:87 (-) Transcript_3510:386-646(-)